MKLTWCYWCLVIVILPVLCWTQNEWVSFSLSLEFSVYVLHWTKVHWTYNCLALGMLGKVKEAKGLSLIWKCFIYWPNILKSEFEIQTSFVSESSLFLLISLFFTILWCKNFSLSFNFSPYLAFHADCIVFFFFFFLIVIGLSHPCSVQKKIVLLSWEFLTLCW